MAQLEYSINSKGPVAIVTLKGVLNENTGETVKKMKEELLELKGISHWIINVKDLSDVRMVAHRDFVHILTSVRSNHLRKTVVKISGLNSKLNEYLKQYGLIRDHELGGDLKVTLSTILQYKVA
jgi:anti-anti-sigma regulatory factor